MRLCLRCIAPARTTHFSLRRIFDRGRGLGMPDAHTTALAAMACIREATSRTSWSWARWGPFHSS